MNMVRSSKGVMLLLPVLLILVSLGALTYAMVKTGNLDFRSHAANNAQVEGMSINSLGVPIAPGVGSSGTVVSSKGTAGAAAGSGGTTMPVGCHDSCSNTSCASGLACQTVKGEKICVNASCPTSNLCLCSTPKPTSTPRPSGTPKPTPIPAAFKRVFITNQIYTGNLGGLAGADSKCQESAKSVGLGVNWKAWLSDSTHSVASRFTHFNGPYKLFDGIVVANSWSDLIKGSLRHSINENEYGSIPTTGIGPVWTNTNWNGRISDVSTTCSNWSSSEDAKWSYLGNVTVSAAWTDGRPGIGGDEGLCSASWHLYCFEQ